MSFLFLKIVETSGKKWRVTLFSIIIVLVSMIFFPGDGANDAIAKPA